MHRRHFILCLSSLLIASETFSATSAHVRDDWARLFSEADAQGTIVVLDARSKKERAFVHDPDRAAQRYSPASTFKIPHSLFALDAGLLRDEFHVVPWDGIRRQVDAWNADQDLRSAMRNSTVWVYERFAQQLGARREADYLRQIGYGNALASGVQPFWIEGDLAISADEQIAFLRRLYRNELPFRVEHQRLVKDVMIVEAGENWILRAKSGWSGKIGWWTGWVEWPDGPVFFSLNIDTPNRLADLNKRQEICRRVLRSMNALPAGRQ